LCDPVAQARTREIGPAFSHLPEPDYLVSEGAVSPAGVPGVAAASARPDGVVTMSTGTVDGATGRTTFVTSYCVVATGDGTAVVVTPFKYWQ